MPRYQFNTHPDDGLIVDLFIGVSVPYAGHLMRAGLTAPRPFAIRALIDTGADRTSVSAAVVTALGLQHPTSIRWNQTASAAVTVRLFEMAVGFPSAVTGGPPVFWNEAIEVVELTTSLGAIDALIGLDLLLASRFTLDGPAGTFALEF